MSIAVVHKYCSHCLTGLQGHTVKKELLVVEAMPPKHLGPDSPPELPGAWTRRLVFWGKDVCVQVEQFNSLRVRLRSQN